MIAFWFNMFLLHENDYVTAVDMATFESCQDKQTESMEYKKFPLRRLEPAIQKFLKVIQIDLARLHRHKLNMERVSYWNERVLLEIIKGLFC